MKTKKTLKDLYAKIRQKHPSVLDVGEAVIDSLEEERRRLSYLDGSTLLYIVVTAVAIFFLATYPILIVAGYRFVRGLQVQLATALSQEEFLDNHFEVVVASFFTFLAVLVYTLMPTAFFLPQANTADSSTPGVERKSRPYVAYASIANYFAILIPLLFLYSYKPIPESFTYWVTVIWLMIPIVILCFLPAVLLFLILSIVVVSREPISSKSAPPFIILGLLQLLDNLDEIRDLSALSFRQREELVDSVADIAFMISTMYSDSGLIDGATIWSNTQMRRAGDNFLSLGSWIYFPQSNTFENLKERVCFYLNIFLSGHYHDLPREEVGEQTGLIFAQPKISGLRKFLQLAMFAIYMGVPIAIFAALTSIFKIEVPSLIQSALSLLYVIWAVVGLISFSERFAPDAKTFLMEIIKSYVQRK